MSEVSVHQFKAAVTLPFPDIERAKAALRGELRLQAAYTEAGPQAPDWTTMVVTELDDDTDNHGRTWWRWSATVSSMPPPAAGGSAPTTEPPLRP
ncbi:hypothetical protein SAMN05660199_03967 [Klenkia soli]|uniref:Uncharacterized protein n=1 Tax=Klenkia soli TaxID=1052260 RepID=A0A1H0SZ18_9ACTN|nr:hypothetical protein SAMN05660199_03967 [Klenkia soli]